jgi:hypothetical protein
MRKVAYAIKKSKMPNKEHQLKLLKDFGTAKSEKILNFLKYPENAYVFICLIPLLRLLPINQ